MNNNYFVLLYKTVYGYYLYDANYNEIISLYKDLYEYIELYIESGKGKLNVDTKILSDFNNLIENGYIRKTNIKNIEHPYTSLIKYGLNRKIDQITLQVTQNCNLRCSYCIYSATSNFGQRTHSKKKMTLAIAKKAIDFYESHSLDSDVAAVCFYGGEPLLEMRLIKDIVKYTKKKFYGKEISFAITTNATLLTDEVIDYLISEKFVITFSVDGPKDVQNKNRKFISGKGSFDIVIDNINKLYNKHPDYMKYVTISMVVDSSNNYNEIIKLFKYKALKNVRLTYTTVEIDGLPTSPSDEYAIGYFYDLFKGYVEYFREVDEKKYPSKFIEQDFKVIDKKISDFKSNELSVVSAPSGPCLPGKTRLFIDCDGDLYPCERVNENEYMKIGSLDEGFDFNMVYELLNISQYFKDSCKYCWAFQLCDICAKRIDDNGKFSEKKKATACKNSKNNAFNLIRNKVLEYENSLHEKRISNYKLQSEENKL